MADKDEYYHPKDKPPGNAPYDPLIGAPVMRGRRWKIDWFRSGKELPKIDQGSDMDGTRVLDAGKATPGRDLNVITYKDHFRYLQKPFGVELPIKKVD
jgi:hypothetical protein